MKVQDVSHRTGQGVGHTLVEVTKKHKDMEEGRGRGSERHNPKKIEGMQKEREKVIATGENVEKGYKEERGFGGEKYGGTLHKEKVKSRGGIVWEKGCSPGG